MISATQRGSAKIILALLFLICSSNALATSWAYVPLAQRVAECDAIVIGPLTDIQGPGDYMNAAKRMKNRVVGVYDDDSTYTGFIVVERALAGAVKPGDRLPFMCYSYNYPSELKTTGLWMLRKKGNVYVCYHDDYRPLGDEVEIQHLLHEPVALVSKKYDHPAGADVPVQLRIRNEGEKPITIRPPDLSRNIDVTTSGTEPAQVFIRFQEDKTTGTLTIPAHKIVVFPMVLNKIIKLDASCKYEIRTKLEGFPISSRLELRVYGK